MDVKNKIIEEIRKIYDPELPVNIYELGLIYDIKVNGRKADIKMTLTTPNCPVAESLPKEVKDKIISEIRKIYDPELPVNIYELGLIYDIKVNGRKAEIKMTLTTPNCPVAESLPKEVKEGAMQVEEIDDVDLQLVWDPPWTKDMMSDAAKLELNL